MNISCILIGFNDDHRQRLYLHGKDAALYCNVFIFYIIKITLLEETFSDFGEFDLFLVKNYL